jgi:excisionase family DNA binding protein
MAAAAQARTPPPDDDFFSDLISFEDAAKLCTIEVDTFRRWVAKGVLPHVTVNGGLKRVRRRDVLALLRYVG